MFITIDTETLNAIWTEVKAVKKTGELPKWIYDEFDRNCFDPYAKIELSGAAVVCWYEFCLQSTEPAKSPDDWYKALQAVNGYYMINYLLISGFLKHECIHNNLTIYHDCNITHEKKLRVVLQPQVGRRYEHKTKKGFYGLTFQQVVSILEAVGIQWKKNAEV